MASPTSMATAGIDPRRTERFLLTLPEVVEASVWVEDSGMKAHVTVSGDPSITARRLQSECLHSLGVHQTPREVYLIWANQLVA